MSDKGFEFLRPLWPSPQQVQALVTTRLGGVSQAPYCSFNIGDHVGDLPANVIKNRSLLQKSLPAEPIWLRQTHGTGVSIPNARTLDADAIVSNTPNEVLAIMTADCLPVLFTNTTGTIIGAAHAGWRGLCAGVLEKTIAEMHTLAKNDLDRNMIAWFGPAIGPKAFEVGQDVVDAFENFGVPYPINSFKQMDDRPGKYLANIYALARSRLEAIGISDIHGGDFCTVSEMDRFFSYRRDGVTGRFASLIWLSR